MGNTGPESTVRSAAEGAGGAGLRPAGAAAVQWREAPLSREQIEEILPHRPPFLLLDEVLELEPSTRVVARLRVRDEHCAGHFPGNPIMPGVLMVEALAQAGAVAVLSEEANRGKLALFAGIDDVRFKRIVRPGDELTLACDLEQVRGPIGRGKARATVGDELAVRGTLTFAVGDEL
jgi:3-hydroxyacyl-[acyl-carrier-protein] dehydratase